MRQTTVALPALRRPRTTLQAHSPLHAHALLETTQALTQQGKRSAIAEAIAAALPGTTPVSALDIATTGLPLGAVLAEVGELADTGALRVSPPLAAGDPAAAKLVVDLDSSAGTEFDDPVSMKIAVSGPSAHAVVESLGQPHPMEGIADRLPGHTPRPWEFTRLTSGAGVVYVVADTAESGEEAWYQLLRGAVGLVVTVDASTESRYLARRAVVEARVAGLPCALAGPVVPEQVHPELGALVPVAAAEPHDTAGSRAALELLAQTIESGGHR